MSVQSKQTTIPDLPKYHKFNDDFINDPNSMRFQFTSVEDVLWNEGDISIDGWTGNQPVSHSKKKTRSMRVQYQNSKTTLRTPDSKDQEAYSIRRPRITLRLQR